MSYVIFGTFNLRATGDEGATKEAAFQLVERALAQRLHIQLGSNIAHAGPLLEMLGFSSTPLPPDRLLFLLTDSPISDTSDELISPYCAGIEDEPSLQVNLFRIQRFLRSVRDVKDITSIDLYFTEGFDVRFERKALRVDEFYEATLQAFGPAPEIPSTHFAVSLRAS